MSEQGPPLAAICMGFADLAKELQLPEVLRLPASHAVPLRFNCLSVVFLLEVLQLAACNSIDFPLHSSAAGGAAARRLAWNSTAFPFQLVFTAFPWHFHYNSTAVSAAVSPPFLMSFFV